jgi:error-prone DNA polymerase
VQAQLLRVDGHLEAADGIRHVIAGRLTDLSPLLTGLEVRSRDFR